MSKYSKGEKILLSAYFIWYWYVKVVLEFSFGHYMRHLLYGVSAISKDGTSGSGTKNLLNLVPMKDDVLPHVCGGKHCSMSNTFDRSATFLLNKKSHHPSL